MTSRSLSKQQLSGGATQAIERAMDLALIVMRNGGSTDAADRAFQNILTGHGQEGSATWRLDIVTAWGVADGRPPTILRPVGSIGVSVGRVSEAVVLAERVGRGEVDAAALDSEIERMKAIAPSYGSWTLIAAAAFTAAFFAKIPGGDWGASGIAFVAAGSGQFLRSRLQAMKVAVVNATFICGLLSACIAALGLRLGFSQIPPATVIAAVVYLVPGLSLINGFVDVISHKHLFVGLERIANSTFLFVVLAIAIALADAIVP